MKKDKLTQNELNNPAKSSPNVKEIAKEKKPQRKAEKKQKRMKRNSRIFVLLHAIISLLFLVGMFTLGILPFFYAMEVVAVVLMLFLITWRTQKGKKAGRILGRIYAFFIMIILLCGSFVMGTANYILDEVTGALCETKEEKFDLMSMGNTFSIEEDPFCVYVEGMKDDLIVETISYSKLQILLSVNTNTNQMLRVVTIEDCMTTVPGVTKGQKDTLRNIKELGVEASMAAHGNLYETKVPYYLKIDSLWARGLAERMENLSVESIKQLAEDVIHISDYVRTNMKKSEVQTLIKKQIREWEPWDFQTTIVGGEATSTYTFTSPDEPVDGMIPRDEEVKDVIKWINRMEDDEILKDVNPIMIE